MPERYLSPALRGREAVALTAPLQGVEAQIYDRLWNAILDRKLRPGTKLPEEEIGSAFKVSRTVVRKVLVIMEQQGIVHLPANRGAYVAAPTPEEAMEAFEGSRVIATHIVGALAANPGQISADARERLDAHYQAQQEAAAANDYRAMRRLVVEFHVLLAIIYGNMTMASAQERLMMRGAMAITLYQEHLVQWPPHTPHRELVELIFAGDVDGALAAVENLFRSAEASLRLAPVDQTIDLEAILLGEEGPQPTPGLSKRYGKKTPGKTDKS